MLAAMGVWRRLVDLHREVESTAWGAVLLASVWPAYIFALFLAARVWRLLQTPVELATLDDRARLLEKVVTIAFLALVVALFIIRKRSVRGHRAAWREGLVAVAGTFLLNVVAFLPVEESASAGTLLASSAVVVVGTAFTIWSLATLGRCFGVLPEVRGLVIEGPYRLVRHPVYLGEMVSAAGLLIARPHPITLFTLILFVGLQYARTVYEERALSAVYTAEYPAYQRRVPRLVPGLR